MPRPAMTLRAALTGLLLAATTVHATTMVRFDTPGLARQSHQIVIGRVAATRAHWNEAHTRILTDVDVDVTETLKGGPAQHVTLTQIGGEVDGVRMNISGCASFRPGEEAVLFVWHDARGRAQLTGLAQGKFEIERDARTGARTVQRRAPGFAVSDLRALRQAPAGRTAPTLALDDFVREIRAAVADSASGGAR